ncbi:hypothetical protein [Scandinavium goeteborgense]|uniref:Uncharacterized protein n=1 Tax=Scandinavium goeteborgense TaxID=1851514 RepID=A0A4R6EWY8_SCAGO|nr:hypothetical protein [Scandinavium goeteborgense]TDN64259.1 hypothetical protein EC847_101183 [Scandinavium goeteborgense]
MQIDGIKDAAFNAAIQYPGSDFFVTNGLKGDSPVDGDGYLVMVNDEGDRIAFRSPGADWVFDSKPVLDYNKQIPNYTNAIKLPMISIENE